MQNFENEYEKFVISRVKDPVKIIESMTPEKANLWHMATGIAGEAGELLDQIKKHAIYNKELDIENVKEELGDLEFYMSGIRSILSIDRDDILSHNMEKLSKRYQNGYSDKQAIERKDKENDKQ